VVAGVLMLAAVGVGVGPSAAAGELTLREAVASLPVAAERREGYSRDLFRHWIDADKDGCSTRNEVLIEEALEAPLIEGPCKLSEGRWLSYYDDVIVEGPSGLDIDHMVPLAEAWDSGAHSWTAERRRDYANDLDDPRSLVAVTARSNRSKGDQDPATWLPPAFSVRCQYIAEWTAVKLRWGLSADETEKTALTRLAEECPDVPLAVAPAP